MLCVGTSCFGVAAEVVRGSGLALPESRPWNGPDLDSLAAAFLVRYDRLRGRSVPTIRPIPHEMILQEREAPMRPGGLTRRDFVGSVGAVAGAATFGIRASAARPGRTGSGSG